MTVSTAFPELLAFRSQLHGCFTRRADALFELADAMLTADAVASPPHLSLEPGHQRGWGSIYAALARGRIDTAACQQTISRSLLPEAWPVFAVDMSTWPRCDAEASPERGFYYHPSRHSATQPIVAGWAYQWIAQLSPAANRARDSWTAPVDARRIHPTTNTNQAAVEQISRLLQALPRGLAPGPAPLFVFDAGYDRSSSAPAWPAPAPQSWSGCARAAAWTPTRHQPRPAGSAGPAATAPSSTPAIRPAGPPRARR